MLPSPLLGTAPEMVSGARSPAAARLGGPHGRPEALGPGAERMDPAGRRGAEPETHGALLPGRGAAGRAELAVGSRLARECHFLTWSPRDFHRLLRCLGVFSSARRGGRASAALRLSGRPERARARGARGRGGRGGGARRRGSCSRSPRSCLQTASGEGTASILSPSPALAPSLFSCLTNPRIIQLRKRWKEVREGGGRGWKFLAAQCLCE